jgi:hypothetical protein
LQDRGAESVSIVEAESDLDMDRRVKPGDDDLLNRAF